MKCEHCGGEEFIFNQEVQELICASCGHIVSEQGIEKEPEWRSFNKNNNKRRVGLPPTLMMTDKGISTVIGAENEDSSGGKITGTAKKDMDRLRMWQKRITLMDSASRDLLQALNELNKLGERLGLSPQILENAANIYRMALERDLIRGRSIKSMVAASLYVSIRLYGVPKSLRELCAISGMDKKRIAKDYRRIVKALGLQIPVIDPVAYVRRICVTAGLDKRVAVEAGRIIRQAQELMLTKGKEPAGVAAGAIYYACTLLGIDKSKREIAAAANVTTLTIRNRYRELKRHLPREKKAKEMDKEYVLVKG